MGYTIPNAPDASVTDQSEPDSVDFVTLGNRSSGVVSGCAVTASAVADQNVEIASGEVLSNGTYFPVTGTTLTLGLGDTTSPRFDLVVVNSSGTVVKRAGTAGSNPTFPVLTAGDVLLAAVYRAAGTADVVTSTRIIDKSITQPSNTKRTGSGTPSNSVGAIGDTYVNTAISSNSGQSQVWFKTAAALWENLAEYTVPETALNTANTLVRRDGSGNFAAGTITASTVIANVTGTLTGNVIGNLTGNVTGNVSGTAGSWASARTINLGGVASGSVSIDGSANVTLSVTGVTTATTATYSTIWWAQSHVGSYYLVNNWDGVRWNITSNHGAGVRVAYADSAGSAGSATNATNATNLTTMTKGSVVARTSPGGGEYPMYAFSGYGLFAFPHGLAGTPTAIVCNGDGSAYGVNSVFSIYSIDSSNITVKVIGWSSGAVRCNWAAFL
jgi:hypothetical protein